MIQENTVKKIHLLPRHLIDQIKAGEVVERPAAILKELMENSLDASSSNISVHIEDGGLGLIAVHDNGDGISEADLPMAFTRHATSKIERFEDLYNLSLFGFRGEALASLASVSKLVCTSVPKEENVEGGKIEFEAGEKTILTKFKSSTHGTSIYVKDLFYNTPARLKFIRSKKSEIIQIKKIITAFLLSHPDVGFEIQWNQNEKEIFPIEGKNEFIPRLKKFLGKKSSTLNFYELNDSYQNHKIHMIFMTGRAEQKNEKISNKLQFLFANCRFFHDRKIQNMIHFLGQQYLPTLEFDYVLFIDVPKDEIDVNVHPNKTELKFSNPQILNALIQSMLKSFSEQILPKMIPSKEHFTLNENSSNGPKELSQFDFKLWQQKKTESNPSETKEQLNKISAENTYKIDVNCYLYRNAQDNFFLVRPMSLLFDILEIKSKNYVFPLGEENIYPILVALPIVLKNENGIVNVKDFLTYIKAFGFDAICEDEQRLIIIVRSYPKFISEVPVNIVVNLFVQSLFNFFRKKGFNENYSSYFHEKNYSIHLLDINSDYQINTVICSKAFQNYLNESKYFLPLDKDLFDAIFRDKAPQI